MCTIVYEFISMFHSVPPARALQAGPHQFKVSPDDVIYTEKLKGVDVNDKVPSVDVCTPSGLFRVVNVELSISVHRRFSPPPNALARPLVNPRGG